MDKSTNQINIIGTIISEPEFNHEYVNEKFYIIYVRVERSSGNVDIIPVLISGKLLDDGKYYGYYARIDGQIRSYNNKVTGKVVLLVFANDIEFLEDRCQDVNDVYLHGFICKKPVFRTTPLGREIADVIIATNRSYNKSDYIPCIMWGRNARWIADVDVGTEIELYGRFQSREYIKDGRPKIAYEVSTMYLYRS